ncbi:enoyl-CoA hydratase [Frondihabitans sp. PAMC 28766]|uniref:enoyl-CoA hydratase/isomerase family protein n=1 Tax=Frondihabitans sp. PAMC 28766 TaxID=1795630 RepID=UPI00078C43D8|nr:enoyl-CoA hydratase-related protein [Frondihabitans sp. PAMC 28766]AMM21851.1 enoyl-CoA hydratase [Frondihabitans sp. PAMC 28766]
MTDDFETLQVKWRDDGIVVATLNRPDRLNSMTALMFDEFELLARRITTDFSVRVLVLTGAGRAFCGGYDIDAAGELATLSAMEMLNLQERGSRGLVAIRNLRIPVIAAVNGAAAGGGLSLALAADIRIASPTARFNAAFARIGLSAGDLGASWLLPRLIGPAFAAELAFTGRFVAADEALRLGLVNSISAEGGVVDDALAMATTICGNSPSGVRLSKTALRLNQEIDSYAAAMELENRGQTLLTRTADMPEALAAFREKRPPHFTGS